MGGPPAVEPILGGNPSSCVNSGVGEGSGRVDEGCDGVAGPLNDPDGPPFGCFAKEAGMDGLRGTTFLAAGANLF